MESDDIESLEFTVSKTKIKYDDLDCRFGQKLQGHDIFVGINLTQVLPAIDEFKQTLVDVKDFNLHAAIAILNLFGHYKHYYLSRDVHHVILIGYVKDSWIYDKYKELLDMVCDFTSFFPNVYMIPSIANVGNLYIHIVASCFNYIRRISVSPHKASINIYSQNTYDRQLLFLFPSDESCEAYKGFNFKPVFVSKEDLMAKTFKDPENEFYLKSEYKAELEMMNVFIGKYLGTIRLNKSFGPKIKEIVYNSKKFKDKLMILDGFFKNSKYNALDSKPISKQFIQYLKESGELLDEESYQALIKYENYYDYKFQDIAFLQAIIGPIFESWRQKIKDYAIMKESEKYKILVNHNLYVNWLS